MARKSKEVWCLFGRTSVGSAAGAGGQEPVRQVVTGEGGRSFLGPRQSGFRFSSIQNNGNRVD
jgi:hypothetical protein